MYFFCDVLIMDREKRLLQYKKDFIYNALDDGWSVVKKQDYYIFKKKHEERKEVFLDSYLTKFIERNMNLK